MSTIVAISFAGNVLTNGCINVIAQRGRLLDARAGARAHMNLELPGIDRRKEVLPQPGHQQRHRGDHENQKGNQKDPA